MTPEDTRNDLISSPGSPSRPPGHLAAVHEASGLLPIPPSPPPAAAGISPPPNSAPSGTWNCSAIGLHRPCSSERLMRCRCLAVRIRRAGRPCHGSRPPGSRPGDRASQRSRPFIAPRARSRARRWSPAAAPAGQPREPPSSTKRCRRHRIAEQRDHPVIRSAAAPGCAAGVALRPGCFPGSEADHQEHRGGSLRLRHDSPDQAGHPAARDDTQCCGRTLIRRYALALAPAREQHETVTAASVRPLSGSPGSHAAEQHTLHHSR